MAFGRNMEEEKKITDLEEDEELAALRLAALATLKSRSAKKSEHSSNRNRVLAISSISASSTAAKSSSHIPFIQTDRVYSSYNGHNTWRKHPQSSRRRGGSFSKSSQRSNLIVISPVSLDNKTPPEEKSTLPCSLPQYKWKNSGNEDSMSPKTYRRTGPTRFNRHESGSDSDSDMDNSDNDSCSNETVLQDEPSARFSCLSPEESNNNESDTVSESEKYKTSDRRLSFHNLDSDFMHDALQKSETTSVYNCLKNSYTSIDSVEKKLSVNYRSIQNSNDMGHTRNHDEDKYIAQSSGEENGHTRNSEPLKPRSEITTSLQSFDRNEECAKSENCSKGAGVKQVSDSEKPSWKHSETYNSEQAHLNRNAGLFSKESHDHFENDHKISVRSETKVHSLSQNDLRLELKKRVHDYNSKRISNTNRQNELYDNMANSYSHHSERHRRSFVHSRSRESSRERTKRQKYHRSRHSSSRSRSSSSSSTGSSSSSSSSNSSPTIRSVPSVIKPVVLSTVKSESKSHSKVSEKKSHFSSSETDHSPIMSKNTKEIDDSYNCTSAKVSLCSSDNQNHASEPAKRMPVHMRLGSFPRKRIIKMTKDVEAAFVNSSSDDDMNVNIKCKKQNIRIVTKICGNDTVGRNDKVHVEKSPEKRCDNSRERSRRMKIHR